jgi:hypothetical protein
MKGTVNPFEPWRPAESPVPPPLHVNRPWRPPAPAARAAVDEPLAVEPVDPPRAKRPQHPPRPKRPQGRATPSSTGRTPFSHLVLLGLFLLLMVLGIDSLGWLRGTHLPRLIALGTSAGILAGISLSRRRDWPTRLTWMAIALACAGFAAWFVPTLRGVSLWSAYRQVDELRALPAGAVAEYLRGAPARRTLVEEFPAFAADVNAAEQAWLRRTVDDAIENADRQLQNDPQQSLADLHQLNDDLARLEQYPSVRHEVEAARRRAMQACLKVVQRDPKGQP